MQPDLFSNNPVTENGKKEPIAKPPSAELRQQIAEHIDEGGGEQTIDPAFEGAHGTTMFDLPNSEDNIITVLLPREHIQKLSSQSLVRIGSRSLNHGGDGREYRGIVIAGPFHEPDGLRADTNMIVIPTINGAFFMPKYHGRVQVEIMGELKADVVIAPLFRPLPNSPVFALDEEETKKLLKIDGEMLLGQAVGHNNMEVFIPRRKEVISKHMVVLGNTGGGKSTTNSGLISQFQKQDIATIVFDTEGEYTHIDKPTEDEIMIGLLKKQGKNPEKVSNIHVYHLTGRDTKAEPPTPISAFKLNFSNLSPYAAADILDLNDTQRDRFFDLYDLTKFIMKTTGIYPKVDDIKEAKEASSIDELETGYPKMTLSLLIDMVEFVIAYLSKDDYEPFNKVLQDVQTIRIIKERLDKMKPDSKASWKAVKNRLWRLHKPGIFDQASCAEISYKDLLQPGKVSIIDLSDTDSTMINNLVIANLLRGIQLEQDRAYEQAVNEGKSPTPAMIIIEEAHEFLHKDRIAKMDHLFQQVARIARRGRKRWLGLLFSTQLPQHLPDEVLGLVNNHILHKINDATVVSRLKKSIGGIDESLWNKLPNLASGQAIVNTTRMARSLLVAINPTPCKLLMIE